MIDDTLYDAYMELYPPLSIVEKYMHMYGIVLQVTSVCSVSEMFFLQFVQLPDSEDLRKEVEELRDTLEMKIRDSNEEKNY